MEAALRDALLANAALTALVGGKIYWDAIPDRVSGAAIVLTADAEYEHTHKGRTPTGRSFLTADCRGANRGECILVRDALLTALDALKAQSTAGGVLLALPKRSYGDWQQAAGPDARGATKVFLQYVDFDLWFRPPQAA